MIGPGNTSTDSCDTGSGRPGAAVVIPHFERISETAACCSALAAQSYAPLAVIVVDNASRTHTREELARACPGARILRLESNRGFAGGVNAGLRAAMEDPAAGWFWVLNNDTTCAPRTLERLVACIAADGRIGLVGCPLLEGDEAARRRIVPAGKDLLWPWGVPVRAARRRAPGYISGASLLIRRALLEEIGLFDEGFFFFFEDADISLRARRAGWRLAVAADAIVTHTGSATIGTLSELQARYYRAGHVRLLRKHVRWPWAAALPPFFFRLLADGCRGRGAALRGALAGWRAGWRQPLPPAGIGRRLDIAATDGLS